MGSVALSVQGHASGGTLGRAAGLPVDVLKRRVSQRRQMLIVEAGNYWLIALVLSIYSYAGTVSVAIPVAYFLSGLALIGSFAVLSENHVNDRFEDHYLTIFQVG